jgi:hypothetical protein
MKRGLLHEWVDTLVVKDSNTILGGCAVWVATNGQAVDDAAAGATAYHVGVAMFDAAAGDTLSVVRSRIAQCLATDAETIGVGDLVKVSPTTGKWAKATIADDDAHGRAWSPTTGGTGEYFECELFQTPIRAEV